MPHLQKTSLHATALHIGDHGILLTGPSGSGKSQLAYELMTMAKRDRLPFGLIADDLVSFKANKNATLMTYPPKSPEVLRGMMEMRGFGLVKVPFSNAHQLTHVYALSNDEAMLDSHRQLPPKPDWPEISLPMGNAEPILWRACPVFSGNIAHCAKIIALHAGFALPL